jgi:transcriptional regulator with GAF, ATPase, and Fis domain
MDREVAWRIWREACQHLNIDDSIQAIATLVGELVPARTLIVRRFDPQRESIQTVAIGVRDGANVTTTEPTTACSSTRMRALLDWCVTSSVWHRASAGSTLLEQALPADVGDADVLAVALRGPDGPIGMALLSAVADRTFDHDDEAIARQLQEPLGVALINHLRLQDLARTREALEADNRALLSRLERTAIHDDVVGRESGLSEVMARVHQVAPTDAPVLLLGETGTGKEVIARTIHAESRRAQGPIVRVNCGAIPAGLIDSELFGHERGSFTGAHIMRKGWFERADGGTLFLDEVAELPLDAQVRLLRILQDGTFERMGGQRSLTVDVRIIAATNRDVHEMVASGRFREDLWYRISVFPIAIPPLRERLEDLPLLAGHFASRAGRRLNGVPLYPSSSDVETLLSYSWPGNVRELAAVIERAAILGDGRALKIAAALGTTGPVGSSRPAPSQPDPPTVHATPPPADLQLDAVMAAHIRRVLAAAHGRIEGDGGAAQMLGINPHTLRARMRKLKIDWAGYRPAKS